MEFGEERSRMDEENNFSDINFSTHSFNRTNFQSFIPIEHLLQEIKENIWGYDLILCLFVAALQSYRVDRCLRPFPPSYVNEEGKNFGALKNTCDNIPPLKTILNEPNKCSQEVKNLLIWLFLEKGYPLLKRINFNNIPFPSKISYTFKPHFLFEIHYHEKMEKIWKKRKAGRETILAYHGSTVDNFYSILKVGLQQHFSLDKDVLFGNGIYLSNELAVSAHYAPFGQTWTNSALGNKHSIVAVCEVINDIDKVKCRDMKNKKRSINKGGFGEIPEKYFVVTDSDMVRVKYLMVYREKTVFSLKSYLIRNLFLYLLILYFILIVVIGIFNSSSCIKYVKRLSQIFIKC